MTDLANTDRKNTFLTLLKIWIVFTGAIALCGLEFSLFLRLWFWFYTACIGCTLLTWLVLLFVYPLRRDRTTPSRRWPYED